MNVEGNFIHICTIRSFGTPSQNGAGEEIPGTITDVTGVPCLFGQPKGQRQDTTTGTWVKKFPTVNLPGWATITEGNQIIGTTAPGYEYTYRVETVEPVGLRQIDYYVVELKRVT